MDKRRRIIRNIIVIAVCIAVLGATFGLLRASVAADELSSTGGTLGSGEYIASNMTLTGQIGLASNADTTIDGNGSTITWNGIGDGKSPFNVHNNTKLTVRDVTIVTNSANNAPLFNVAGTLILENVTIKDNGRHGASVHGGAIKFENAKALTLTNVTFNNCSAGEGGAVYIGYNSDASVSITNCNFEDCFASKNAATLKEYYNTAGISYYGGGAICIRNENANTVSSPNGNVTVKINTSNFIRCSANLDGGAIDVKNERPDVAGLVNGSVTLDIRNSTFDGCTAKEGGAIQLAGKGKIDFDLIDSTIKNCSAAEDIAYDSGLSDYSGGGGVNIINSNAGSNYNFSNSIFNGNVSKYNAGAIRILGGHQITDKDNGNSVYTITTGVPSGAGVSITGCDFTANSARRGNALFLYGDCAPKLDITNCLFKDNVTDGSLDPSTAYGGTISSDWKSASIAVISQCLFIGNKSLSTTHMTSGGAVYWNELYGSLKIQDCHFYDNQARGQGGALFFEGKNITVTGTAKPSADRISLDISKLREGALKNKGTLIRDNTSVEFGGGVGFKSCGSVPNLEGGDVTLGTGVLITANKAYQGGGIAYRVEESGNSTTSNIKNGTTYSFTVDGAIISGNEASHRGGGIYMEKKLLANANNEPTTGRTCTMTLNMKSGAITGNNAATNGGGVEVMDMYKGAGGLTELIMSGGIISENSSVTKGGGVLIYGGLFTMNGGEISGNRLLLPVANLSDDDAPNYGGGGVYVHNNTNSGTGFTMNGGNIKGNIASVNGVMPDNATNNANGGGVFVNGGVKMNGGTVIGNQTSGNGGGFYVKSGALAIDSGTVSENKANISGGALAVMGGGGVTIGNESCYKGNYASHSHPVITKNNSVTSGGGAIVAGGTVTMYCGEITGNKASAQASTNNLSVTQSGKFIIYGGYLGMGYSAAVTDNRGTITVRYKDEKGTTTQQTNITKGNEFNALALTALPQGFIKEKAGYSVLGWRAADGTTATPGGTVMAGYGDMEFTIVFTPNCAPLRVTVNDCPEDDNIAIFRVQSIKTDTNVVVDIRIAVQGNRSEIVYLPFGTYKVTVEKGWRYDYNGSAWNGVLIERAKMTDLGVSAGGAANDRWLNYYTIYK